MYHLLMLKMSNIPDDHRKLSEFMIAFGPLRSETARQFSCHV
jgi:hypothetical protein